MMEPLGSQDPTEILGFSLVGRLWQVGALRSFVAQSDGQFIELQVIERPGSPYDEKHAPADLDGRFADAGESLSAIEHPSLPLVLRGGIDPQHVWMVLAYSNDAKLGDVLASGQPLSLPEWQGLRSDLLGALSVVHGAGWTVGQVSPQRVQRSLSGAITVPSPGLGMLLAKIGLPSPGLMAGSIMWLAPEQLRQADPTPASDLFAAGALLAYAATGRMPWGGTGSPTSRIVQALTSSAPDTVGSTYDQQQLIAALTAKGPEYRSAAVAAPAPAPPASEAPASTTPIDGETLEPQEPDVEDSSGVENVAPEEIADLRPAQARRRGVVFAAGGVALAVIVVMLVALGARGDTSDDAQPTAAASAASIGAPSSPSSPAPSPSLGPLTLTTKVDYKPSAVPDQTFEKTARWQASLCVGDTVLSQTKYVDQVRLDRKGASGWRDTNAKAKALTPGRCAEADQVELQIGFTEPTPREEAVGKGWSECHYYRVVIPETPTKRRTEVDLCVTIRADRA